MTIATLIVLPVLLAAPAGRCEHSLVGTWISDARATMSFNRQHAKLEDRQLQFLDSLMGRLRVEFSATEIHLHMPDFEVEIEGELEPFAGFEEHDSYRVLFCNAHMVVIEAGVPMIDEREARTYFFVDENSVWTYAGNNNPKLPDLHIREYFVRVRPDLLNP
ncbi:MAG: hypothetical protein KDI48_16070 [Xanthomonadales bacterium]|nr:hypothetical protein [Xanthomonadales bacterium]